MPPEIEQDVRGLVPERDFDRRDFLWSALGASAALAVSAPASAQLITTDTEGLVAADIGIPTPSGDLLGYHAMPATGAPFPVVLVCAEIFGLNHYTKDVCRRFAKQGYYAIVPDVYWRMADLTKIAGIADIRQVVGRKRDAELVADYDAAIAVVRSTGMGDLARMGVVGMCRGGRTALVYASSNPKLKAAVAWYGPVSGAPSEAAPKTAMDRVADTKVPVLGLYGAKDAGVPIGDVEKYFAALKAAGVPSELVVYPEAGHGFHADFRPDNYRKADAEDGWKRTLAWLARYGVR